MKTPREVLSDLIMQDKIKIRTLPYINTGGQSCGTPPTNVVLTFEDDNFEVKVSARSSLYARNMAMLLLERYIDILMNEPKLLSNPTPNNQPSHKQNNTTE